MHNSTTAISVQLDSKDKEIATNILKKLGLNMSTYINMAIKQLLYNNGLPFEVKNPTNNTQENNIGNTIREKTVNNIQNISQMPNLADFINNN